MKKCIIFDIDGTVADLGHRVHFVQGKKKDWPAFNAAIPFDEPIKPTIWLNNVIDIILKSEPYGMPLYLVSGRSEDERGPTVEWLNKHGVKYDRLMMRKSKDYRADHIIKCEILNDIRSSGYEPFFVVDDRQQVVDMWRREGVFVLQCDPNRNFTAHHDFVFHKDIEFPLTLMVGPSGAGKSSWLKTNPDIEKSHVISSDQIRQDLCGDFKDQSKNNEVFEILHELVSFRLKKGLPVIVDATNIRNSDRKAIVNLAPNDLPVKYSVINRPLLEKKATAGWRSAVSIKGVTLVEKHDQIFKSNLKDIMNGDGFANVTVEVIMT